MTQQATMEAAPGPAQHDQAQLTPTAEEALIADEEALIADELLVEEVSIDGMCGVY